MLGALSRAHPERFLDLVTQGALGRPDTLILACLRDTPGARATAILLRALDSRDWLTRWHAVRGLAHRPEAEARDGLTRALVDPDRAVADEARKALRPRPGSP